LDHEASQSIVDSDSGFLLSLPSEGSFLSELSDFLASRGRSSLNELERGVVIVLVEMGVILVILLPRVEKKVGVTWNEFSCGGLAMNKTRQNAFRNI